MVERPPLHKLYRTYLFLFFPLLAITFLCLSQEEGMRTDITLKRVIVGLRVENKHYTTEGYIRD